MKYFVVDGLDDCEISNTVDEWMKHGWKPQGGICVTIIPKDISPYSIEEDVIVYSQAIINESSDPFYPGIDAA